MSFPTKTLVIIFVLSLSLVGFASAMTSPDLTTWTETDEFGELTVSPDGYSLSDHQQTDKAQVYTNKTDAAFDFKSGKIEFAVTANTLTKWGQVYAGIGSDNGTISEGNEFAGVAIGNHDGNKFISSYNYNGSKNFGNKYTISENTEYYITVDINQTTKLVTTEIYSDSSRTDLLESNSVAFNPTYKYDHLFALNSRDAGSVNSAGNISIDVSNFSYTHYQSYKTESDVIGPNEYNRSAGPAMQFGEYPTNILIHKMDSGTASDFISTGNSSHVPETDQTITITQQIEFFGADGDSGMLKQGVMATNGSAGTWSDGVSMNYREGTTDDGEIRAELSKHVDGSTTSKEIRINYREMYYTELVIDREEYQATATIWKSKQRETKVGSVSLDYANTASLDYFYPAAGNDGGATGHPISARVRNVAISTTPVDFADQTIYNTSQFSGNYSVLGANATVHNTALDLDDVQGTDSKGLYTTKDAPGKKGQTLQWSFAVNSVGSDASEWLTGYSTQSNTKVSGNGKYIAVRQGYLFEASGAGVSIETSDGESGIHSVDVGTQYYVSLSNYPSNSTAKVWVYNNSQRTDLYFAAEQSYNASLSYGYVRPAMPEDGTQATSVTTGQIRDLGVKTISIDGRVITQSGESVPDGTMVEAYGVNPSNVSPDAGQTAQERADELRADLRSFEPEDIGWKPGLTLAGSQGLFASADGRYVAVHSRADWDLEGWTSTPDLERPALSASADREVVLSIWDPSDSPFIQDTVDSDLPGTTDTGTIILETLDYEGSVVETTELETTDTRRTVSPVDADHKFAVADLPPGFYRVRAKDSPVSYVITVGDPAALSQTITKDLETELGKRSARADRVQNLINDKTVVRVTGQTYTKNGEGGHFNLTVPAGVNTVAVQAYSPSGQTFAEDPANITIQDAREIAAMNTYNGSFYMTPGARDVRVPSSGVRLKTVEVSATPFMDPARFINKSEWERNLYRNLSHMTNATQNLNITSEDTRKLRERLSAVVNESDAASERYQELLTQFRERMGRDPDPREDVRLLSQAIRDTQGGVLPEDPSTGYDGGTVSATIPWDGDLSSGVTAVTAHYPGRGTSVPVPDQYVTVDKRMGRSDVVQVENYPVEDGTQLVTFGVTVTGEDGGLGHVTVPARNPSANGVINLRSVSLSTLSPGPSEVVKVTADEQSSGGRITHVNATVSGPNGPASVTNGERDRTTQFTTNGEGSYFVTLRMTSASGTTWTEPFTVTALDENTNSPPSVRARSGVLGPYILASSGMTGGTVSTSTEELTISATADAEDVPSVVHFHTSDLAGSYPKHTLRVQRASGADSTESVRRHVTVYLHTQRLSENAIVYREGSEPLAVGETTTYGTITCPEDDGENTSGGCTIETYTSADGTVDIRVISNPDTLDRVLYWARKNVPVVDVPFVDILSATPSTNTMVSA